MREHEPSLVVFRITSDRSVEAHVPGACCTCNMKCVLRMFFVSLFLFSSFLTPLAWNALLRSVLGYMWWEQNICHALEMKLCIAVSTLFHASNAAHYKACHA